MKNLIFFSLIIIAFLLNSCQEKGLAGDIKALGNIADENLESIEEIDYTPMQNMQKEAQSLSKDLSPYFLSLNKPSSKILVELMNVEKAHRKMDLNPKSLEKDLTYSCQQIDALYHEYKSDSLSEEQAQKHFSDEKKVLSTLQAKTDVMEKKMEYFEQRYKYLIPKAKLIVDSIKGSFK